MTKIIPSSGPRTGSLLNDVLNQTGPTNSKKLTILLNSGPPYHLSSAHNIFTPDTPGYGPFAVSNSSAVYGSIVTINAVVNDAVGGTYTLIIKAVDGSIVGTKTGTISSNPEIITMLTTAGGLGPYTTSLSVSGLPDKVGPIINVNTGTSVIVNPNVYNTNSVGIAINAITTATSSGIVIGVGGYVDGNNQAYAVKMQGSVAMRYINGIPAKAQYGYILWPIQGSTTDLLNYYYSSGPMTAMAWSNTLGKYVAVGYGETPAPRGPQYGLYYANQPMYSISTDGLTWSRPAAINDIANPVPMRPTSVTWSENLGLFVIVGYTSDNPPISTYNYNTKFLPASSHSVDGVTWSPPMPIADVTTNPLPITVTNVKPTIIIPPPKVQLNSIAWSPTLNIFVAVGTKTAYYQSNVLDRLPTANQFPIYTYSTDGVTWNPVANMKIDLPSTRSMASCGMSSVIWSNFHGLFIAVGGSTYNESCYSFSSDGKNWSKVYFIYDGTTEYGTATSRLDSIAVNSTGLIVATGISRLGYPCYAYSVDGKNWSTLINLATTDYNYGHPTSSKTLVASDGNLGFTMIYTPTEPAKYGSRADITAIGPETLSPIVSYGSFTASPNPVGNGESTTINAVVNNAGRLGYTWTITGSDGSILTAYGDLPDSGESQQIASATFIASILKSPYNVSFRLNGLEAQDGMTIQVAPPSYGDFTVAPNSIYNGNIATVSATAICSKGLSYSLIVTGADGTIALNKSGTITTNPQTVIETFTASILSSPYTPTFTLYGVPALNPNIGKLITVQQPSYGAFTASNPPVYTGNSVTVSAGAAHAIGLTYTLSVIGSDKTSVINKTGIISSDPQTITETFTSDILKSPYTSSFVIMNVKGLTANTGPVINVISPSYGSTFMADKSSVSNGDVVTVSADVVHAVGQTYTLKVLDKNGSFAINQQGTITADPQTVTGKFTASFLNGPYTSSFSIPCLPVKAGPQISLIPPSYGDFTASPSSPISNTSISTVNATVNGSIGQGYLLVVKDKSGANVINKTGIIASNPQTITDSFIALYSNGPYTSVFTVNGLQPKNGPQISVIPPSYGDFTASPSSPMQNNTTSTVNATVMGSIGQRYQLAVLDKNGSYPINQSGIITSDPQTITGAFTALYLNGPYVSIFTVNGLPQKNGPIITVTPVVPTEAEIVMSNFPKLIELNVAYTGKFSPIEVLLSKKLPYAVSYTVSEFSSLTVNNTYPYHQTRILFLLNQGGVGSPVTGFNTYPFILNIMDLTSGNILGSIPGKINVFPIGTTGLTGLRSYQCTY